MKFRPKIGRKKWREKEQNHDLADPPGEEPGDRGLSVEPGGEIPVIRGEEGNLKNTVPQQEGDDDKLRAHKVNNVGLHAGVDPAQG